MRQTSRSKYGASAVKNIVNKVQIVYRLITGGIFLSRTLFLESKVIYLSVLKTYIKWQTEKIKTVKTDNKYIEVRGTGFCRLKLLYVSLL